MKIFLNILAIITLSGFSNSTLAFDFERLFMPGEVTTSHQELEDDCSQCHVRLADTTQTQLCLDCHDLVELDLESNKGFHGRNKNAKGSECKICHAEHKGRGANITWLDKDNFDHFDTDYELDGKHLQTKCVNCHVEDKLYREAPSKCINCHKEDDSHEGTLGKQCADCHNPQGWTGSVFDHDKTDFKLVKSHKTVSCESCHIEGKYKDTPKNCYACHSVRDVHQNRFGMKCQSCHEPKKWDSSTFDHNRDTEYRIKGSHKSVTCHTCHTPTKANATKQKGNRKCVNCHKLDDVHKGGNGKKCSQCHSEEKWQDTKFDHDTETEFPLKGAHKDVSCHTCHQGTSDREISSDCFDCHQQNDAHQGQEGENCAQCHNEKSWTSSVRFDHDLTDFPLIGQHVAVGCESCHLSSAFQDAKSTCLDCHKTDDIHQEKLGEDCQTCHNPNSWLIWQFDHDEQTDFTIEGAHIDLHCHSCHIKPLTHKFATECIDCHRQDDIHAGNFGANCSNCHDQDDFKSIDVRSMKSFRINPVD